MDNENQRANIARHIRELRRHLLAVLDWLEKELGPPAPEMGMAQAIEAALGTPDGEAEPLTDRHHWVLSQIAQEIKLTKRHVMEHFKYSERTAKRILTALTKRGLIEFCSFPRPGFYRPCNVDVFRQLSQALESGQETAEADHGPSRSKLPTGPGTAPPTGSAI